MAIDDKLSEKWPWNGEFLRLFLLAPSVIGVTATIATIPFAGAHALWFLSAIFVGAVLHRVYASVGRRVDALKSEFEEDAGDIAETLIVIGRIHSPGIVVLKNDEYELVPIAGERRTISLFDTRLIGEGHWLPGKIRMGEACVHIRRSRF